jgi:transcriptional regulator with XRE-family HTH domain
MASTKAWDRLRAIETSPEYLDVRAEEFPYRDIALAVLDVRGRLGLTQKQLAERVGTSQPVIARLESGRHPVEVTLLVRIAEALGTPIDLRFGAADAEPTTASLDPDAARSGDDLLDRFNAANMARDWAAAHAAAAEIACDVSTPRRRVAMALDAYNRSDYAAARTWAEEALARALPPASADAARLVLGRALVNLERPKDAIKVLSLIANGSAWGWVVPAARADAYVELHNADRALAESAAALGLAGGEPEARFLAARTAWHADRIWEALEHVTIFRTANPDSLDGKLLHGSILGFLASRTSDEAGYRAALSVFELALPSGDCEALRLYALTAARLGDWKRAFATAARLLKHKGDDGAGHCQHSEDEGGHEHWVTAHIVPDAFRAIGEQDGAAILRASADAEHRFGPTPFLAAQRALVAALKGDLAGTLAALGRTSSEVAGAPTEEQVAVAAAHYMRRDFAAAYDILSRVKDDLSRPDGLLRLAECAAAVGELGAARAALEELARADDGGGQVARVSLAVVRAERAAAKAAATKEGIDVRWFGVTGPEDDAPRHSTWEGRHQRTTRMVDQLPNKVHLN